MKKKKRSVELVIFEEDDADICKAYKLTLSRTCDDWESVRDMWKKTYKIRQEDVTALNNSDFFKAWNKFSHAKAYELVRKNIYLFLYPCKGYIDFSQKLATQ